MKQIFYIIALFLAFFFSDSDSNLAFGQNMAQEHYVPWTEADKTGYFEFEKCEICKKEIIGYNKEDFEYNKKMHKNNVHPDMFPENNNSSSSGSDDNNGTIGSSDNSSGSSSENNYSDKASWVYVNDVASALQEIGVCGYNQFIADCEMYGVAKNRGSVDASEMVGFIRWSYNVKSNISFTSAINNNYRFIMLVRPYSGIYYNVYTNVDYKYMNSYVCDYYIVFNN